MKKDLSCTIILPVYNEEAILRHSVETLFETFGGVPNEIPLDILLIDDGSDDGTWKKIAELSRSDCKVSGLRFSRNFGKESAIAAGLSNAKGACVIVMDADLQHPPETALEMYRLWELNDLAIVEAIKTTRQKESAFHKLGANLFYNTLERLAGMDLNNASDFKLLDRSVVELFKTMPERQTFFRAMTGWTGLKSEKVYFEVRPRAAGGTKWSVIKLTTLAVSSISAYTTVPLHWVTFAGIIFLVFAVFLLIQTLYNKIFGLADAGFTTVIVLLLLIGSILMISLGIIGVYIAKIYTEIKSRPRYIVAEKAGKLLL
ncbi:MAG: glycosyltransferase family 2 protein [Clostridiales bacterium]|nr:glycosyltransferase family 2 protein [Clostridiales bacterium]